MISLTVDIEPKVKERPRLCKYGTYTAKRTSSYETKLSALLRKAFSLKPLQGEIKLTVVFVFKPPNKLTRPYPCKGDLDNFVKAFKDAANGILWVDDVQVTGMLARKVYDVSGGNSRITFIVEERIVP